MIRIKLYGISGREQGSYELREDDGPLVIQPKPLFTLERIVVEPVREGILAHDEDRF